ncbi:MAG TPA: hypothetical protein GX390_03655 [Acholeplasmataceae bacterium]|nr:hypothetical protein [Acholeplasmataceae bacterium]
MNDQVKEKKPNFWIRGKRETRNFYNIDIPPAVNTKSFIFGLLAAVLVILPAGIMLFQYLMIYGYLGVFRIYMLISWLGLLLFNGLSNYFTVKIAQAYQPDNKRLQDISAKHVFLYNLLSIGFAIFALIVIILVGLFVFI